MKLVIAEKPSVGAAIAAVMGANEKRSGYFEGGGYLVSWCIGHLISLADAATYNEQFRKWKYDDLPIVPQEWQFIVASGKEQQFSIFSDRNYCRSSFVLDKIPYNCMIPINFHCILIEINNRSFKFQFSVHTFNLFTHRLSPSPYPLSNQHILIKESPRLSTRAGLSSAVMIHCYFA